MNEKLSRRIYNMTIEIGISLVGTLAIIAVFCVLFGFSFVQIGRAFNTRDAMLLGLNEEIDPILWLAKKYFSLKCWQWIHGTIFHGAFVVTLYVVIETVLCWKFFCMVTRCVNFLCNKILRSARWADEEGVNYDGRKK